jgi:hypothetical protein
VWVVGNVADICGWCPVGHVADIVPVCVPVVQMREAEKR